MSRKIVSSPNAASSPYELQFLDTMIAHDDTAIDTAQLVQTRSGHSELKEFARKIISERQDRLAQMHELRNKFFNGSPPAVNMDLPGIRKGMEGIDLDKLDSLKENSFDIEFLKEMIQSHQGAIEMADDALRKLSASTANAQMTGSIRQLAQSVTDTQTSEVRQMNQWEATWSK